MAGPEDLPADVLRFLDSCIDSVEQLRVLLLMHAEPTRAWTTQELTAEIRSTEGSITKRLQDLYARKVLEKDPGVPEATHRYRPATQDVSVVIQALAHQNSLRPYRVIDAIYCRPQKALKQLADAFMLKQGGEK